VQEPWQGFQLQQQQKNNNKVKYKTNNITKLATNTANKTSQFKRLDKSHIGEVLALKIL